MSAAASPQAPPPQAVLMQMAFGFSPAFLLGLAAKLCLADHLADGPQTAEQLAAATGTDAVALFRVMRTLSALGIFSQDQSSRFSLTPISEPLRSGVPGSVRTSILSATGDLFIIPWSKLLYSVQTGKPSFDKHFGAPFFDYISGLPDEASWFHDMLIGLNFPEAPAVAAAYDFTPYTKIADVGGATGHMLTTVLASHHGPHGIVVDLAENQAAAQQLIQARGMGDRASFVAGSFFESIPTGYDVYLMSHIIHDWSEEQCLTILGNCHKAMPANSRLLIVENVLPEGNAFHPGKMLDISMLVLTTGQERSEAEYRTLLEKASFKLNRIIATNSQVSIVEAFPV